MHYIQEVNLDGLFQSFFLHKQYFLTICHKIHLNIDGVDMCHEN